MTTSGLLKWGNLVKCRKQVRGDLYLTSWSSTLILWHRRRIGLFCKITFIPEQTEWPIAKDAEPFSRRFNARQRQTLYDMMDVCLRQWKHLYSWERITQKIYIPSKIQRKISLKKQMFEYLNSWYWNNRMRISGSVSNHLRKFSMETVISGQWWRRHQSLACKGLRILRFCVMSWKDESEPNIKYCLGATVGMVQRFITIQNFGHNRRRTDGIRVKNFLRIHHIAGNQQSPRVHDQNGRSIAIPRTNYLHVDVQWHHMGNKHNETECIANATLVSLFAKRFPARRWSFLGPGSEKKWYSTYNERPGEKWGQSRWIDDQIHRKRTPSFPSHESIIHRSAQKQRTLKIICTFVPMVIRLTLFCAQSFLSISSVSTELSQIWVNNTVAVKQEQGDLLWQSNLTHCSCQQTYW